MKTTFDESWKSWIKTNIDRGCCRDGIFKILLDEGYSYDAIQKQMNYKPTASLGELINPLQQPEAQIESSVERVVVPPESMYIPNAERIDDSRLELYKLDGFLNKNECQLLIERIRSRLQPSGLSSYEADEAFRTSQTCFLEKLDDEFVAEIDRRICALIGIDSAFSESIQGQYYEIGQEFKAHTDYFEAHEIETCGRDSGQRTYTFMIYLNDTEEGGETEFTQIGQSYSPKAGTALIWNNLDNEGNPNFHTMHHALKVKMGFKAIITKWFRARPGQIGVGESERPMFTKELNEFVPTYTREGIHVSRLPEELFKKIQNFYESEQATLAQEHVQGGFIYSDSDKKARSSSLVNLDSALRGEIHDAMKPLLEQWCGQRLEPTYVYGIRVYHDKAVLKSHRDRVETHIISAIINVAQEVDEDWPLVIEDNDYRQHHVILKPGDMVFYEGARLKHGRPLPFHGQSFANIFCHFKPEGYTPVTR